eukprot:1182149-Prorocentrum_minimum.AAC.2
MPDENKPLAVARAVYAAGRPLHETAEVWAKVDYHCYKVNPPPPSVHPPPPLVHPPPPLMNPTPPLLNPPPPPVDRPPPPVN